MNKPRLRCTSKGWFFVWHWMAGRKVWRSDIILPDEHGRLGLQTALVGPYPTARAAFEAATR